MFGHKKRFIIRETTGPWDRTLGRKEVRILDKETKKMGIGRGKTVEEAEQNAWFDLEEKIGPIR